MSPADDERGVGDPISAETRLAYEDLAAGVLFLSDAFGFGEREGDRLAEPDGDGFTATWVDVGDTAIMVGRAGDHGLQSPRRIGTVTAMIVVTVHGIEAHYGRAVAAGARIVTDLEDVPWGFRRYEALDSEGHRWHFMESIER